VVFQAYYDKIELQNINYDVIFGDVIANTLPKNVSKLTSQNFSILAPSPIKISGYASVKVYNFPAMLE